MIDYKYYNISILSLKGFLNFLVKLSEVLIDYDKESRYVVLLQPLVVKAPTAKP